MVKQKKVSDMKTSEIIDELGLDPEDEMWGELDTELNTRSPFTYFNEQIYELTEKVETLESNFSKHSHVDGKIVKEI